MSYYRLLGLTQEPFSTSPDPAFLYQSPVHRGALIHLEVAVRLRRGLILVLGDVGTGKTTVSRRLYQELYPQPNMSFQMILNPSYTSELEFLHALLVCFHILPAYAGDASSVHRCLHLIERELFRRAGEQDQTVILLIDEAQKLTPPSLEVLRILLNYETNQYKLLQVILFSQLELLPRIKEVRNLWDRISMKYFLGPLDEKETRQMIDFRLRAAGYQGRGLFTQDAIHEIYRTTQGYPRRIAMMAHDALECLVMFNRRLVDRQVILEMMHQGRYRISSEAAP